MRDLFGFSGAATPQDDDAARRRRRAGFVNNERRVTREFLRAFRIRFVYEYRRTERASVSFKSRAGRKRARRRTRTNMTLAEGGNRPSSSSSSLPRDANGTKIERKKGAAILSTRGYSTIYARDATATRFGSVGADGGKSKCERTPSSVSGAALRADTERSVGHIGGS